MNPRIYLKPAAWTVVGIGLLQLEMGMLKICFCKAGIIAAALAALPAQAADVVSETTNGAPPPAIAAPDWSGPYLGVHAGIGWADIAHTDTFGAGPTVDYTVNGGLIGGHLGYNWQFGQTVIGVEGDWSWSDVSGSTAGPPIPATFDMKSIASIRGRAGWAFDSVLLFATAGVGWADIDVTQPPFGSGSHWHNGWMLGAGGEWRANDSISVRAEYLYGDFGEESYAIGGAPDLIEFKTHTIRATLNWHFGFWQ